MNASKSVVGIDIAKRVFQLYWIDMETGEVSSLQLKREKFLEHFANRQACLIGMEACGGSHHWARKLTALGHQVKLLPESPRVLRRLQLLRRWSHEQIIEVFTGSA